MEPLQPYIPLSLAVLFGTLWLALEIAVPHNDKEWPNVHRWFKEVCRIVFAAAVLAALLRLSYDL